MYSEKELIIEANHSYQQYWHDLWEYKRLFYFFTWRDIKVKYKQTAIGVIWSVIQWRPLFHNGFMRVVAMVAVF